MDLEVKIKDKNTIFSRIILGQVGVMNYKAKFKCQMFYVLYLIPLLILYSQTPL